MQKMEKKEYKLYCLKDLKTHEIRYVGITTSYLSSRKAQHKCNAITLKKETRVSKWIRSLYKNNNDFYIELLEICTKDNWEEKEKYWISNIENLTNIQEGGAGVVINRDLSSIERSAKAHEIPIVSIDKYSFETLKEFESITKAANYYNISKTSIGNNLKKRSKSCNDLIFVYKDKLQFFKKEEYKKNYGNSIYQYDLDGNFVCVYKKLNSTFKLIKNWNSYSVRDIIDNNKISNKSYWSWLDPKSFSHIFSSIKI